jgi:hypothetical protein
MFEPAQVSSLDNLTEPKVDGMDVSSSDTEGLFKSLFPNVDNNPVSSWRPESSDSGWFESWCLCCVECRHFELSQTYDRCIAR